MAKTVTDDAYFEINGVDLSDHCKRLTVDLGQETRDASCHGNTQRVHRAGVQTVSAEALLLNNHASGSVEATLRALVVGTSDTGFSAVFKSKNTTASTTNPRYAGTAIIDGPVNVLNHEHGELPELTVRLLPYSEWSTTTTSS